MKKLCPIHYKSIKKKCDTIRGYSISFGTKIVEKADLVDKSITFIYSSPFNIFNNSS